MIFKKVTPNADTKFNSLESRLLTSDLPIRLCFLTHGQDLKNNKTERGKEREREREKRTQMESQLRK